MNNEQMQAKFEDLYGKDADMPHSCKFLQDNSVCYKDDRLTAMKNQIDVKELQADVDGGYEAVVAKNAELQAMEAASQ